ncbi:hypothetical protein [Sphingobium sp. TomTYG75]
MEEPKLDAGSAVGLRLTARREYCGRHKMLFVEAKDNPPCNIPSADNLDWVKLMSFMNIDSAHLGAQLQHQTCSASAASTISRRPLLRR